MNFIGEYSNIMKFIHDHIMNNSVLWHFKDTTIYSVPGEDGEYAIRISVKGSVIPNVCVYAIEVSPNCVPNIKSMHIKELQKLKLVVSNKNLTSAIFLHTRILGKGKYPRKLYGIHRIPIEFKNCVFEPSAIVGHHINSKEITLTNCEILG